MKPWSDWRNRTRVFIHPKPEVGQVDTSLRYTDILFGFVIRELFIRLQNWGNLDGITRSHLAAGTTLVLGSWIGYRRSRNRSAYEVKFFNLPFFRFLADQCMLILYFRLARMTLEPKALNPSPAWLGGETLTLIFEVFVLYAIWDGLAICMAFARDSTGWRYPAVDEQTKKSTSAQKKPDWYGFSITFTFLILFLVAKLLTPRLPAEFLLWATAILLLLYRWVKEIRTTWLS